MKLCTKCGKKPACEKSTHAVRKTLCFKCGTEPHIDALAKANIAKRKAAVQFDHGNKGKGKQ